MAVAARAPVLVLAFVAGVLASAGRPVLAQECKLDTNTVAQVTADWPQASRTAAQEMMQRYGPPQEATPTMLIWTGNAPWTRSIVHKSPVEHDFPIKHQDVLEQAAPYRVPLNFFEPIATFDGSVIPDRTRGEIMSRGDHEATNILAINLARDIIRGEKTVEQARAAMAAAAQEIAAGKTPADAKELRLGSPQGDLSDPDTAVVTSPSR